MGIGTTMHGRRDSKVSRLLQEKTLADDPASVLRFYDHRIVISVKFCSPIGLRWRLPRSANWVDPELVGMGWPVWGGAEHAATRSVGSVAGELVIDGCHRIL